MTDLGPPRIGLLYGGTWDERDISIASATEVCAALRAAGLRVSPLRWDDDGWVLLPSHDDVELTTSARGQAPADVLERFRSRWPCVIFNCLHGGPGEDGTVQGFLELVGIPYTGAGVHGSVVTGNKETFRRVVPRLGAQVADGFVTQRRDWMTRRDGVLRAAAVDVGFPVIVKPLDSGSSYGVFLADDADAFCDAVDEVISREPRALVERFIAGREISVPVLGTRHGEIPEALPIVEIEPLTESGIFDLDAKYTEGKAREVVPAPIDDDLADHLSLLAVRIHDDLDLGGVSRTDIILGADGPVVLESQTVPGFTSGSLLPLCAAAAGLDLTALCRRIIDYALSVHLARGLSGIPSAGDR